MTRAFSIALALLLVLPAAAGPADDSRLRRDIEGALLAGADRGELGTSDRPLEIEVPSQVIRELGAVVVPSGGEAVVMAVTPGSAAERMRLRPGDRLVELNGMRFAGAHDPAAALDAAMQSAGDDPLSLTYVRDGKRLRTSGSADVTAIPAYRLVVGAPADRCGHVSDTAGTVPRSRDIFRARVTRIDGRSTPLQPKHRLRVDAGRHVLTVREQVDRNRIGRAAATQIARMQKFEDARAYKPLVVHVEPDRTYYIGARLLRDRLDAESIRANAYWEPVVWEVVEASCD